MTSDQPGRKPDYSVAAMNDKLRAPKIGGAWLNEDGSIYIKLDPFIHLNNDQGDLQIRLFPAKEKAA